MMLNNSGPALAIAAGACTLLWCPGYYSCCWREKLLLSLVWSLMYIVVIVISVIVILSQYCCFDYCNYYQYSTDSGFAGLRSVGAFIGVIRSSIQIIIP